MKQMSQTGHDTTVEPITPQPPPQNTNNPVVFAVIMVCVLVVFPYFGYIAIEGGVRSGVIPPTPTPSPKWPEIGQVGTLTREDGDVIVLTTDFEAFRRLKNATLAKDKYGLQELLNDNKIIYVPSRTKAKYLEGDPMEDVLHVRILDGLHQGKDAWTFRKPFQQSQ
jgi:hypothetical protein